VRANVATSLICSPHHAPLNSARNASSTFTVPFTDFVPSDDCRPDVSAMIIGTEVLVGQRVETPSGTSRVP
jgi:hypothetical protein